MDQNIIFHLDEEEENRYYYSSSSPRDSFPASGLNEERGKRISGCSESNHAEMIVDNELLVSSNNGGGFYDKINDTQSNGGLSQIVESCEFKMMRRLSNSNEQQPREKGGRRASKLSLTKSPVFATNTLDEEDLNRLATSGSGCSNNCSEETSVATDQDNDDYDDKLVKNHLNKRKQHQHQQQQADLILVSDDCKLTRMKSRRDTTTFNKQKNLSTTNMINRLHEKGKESSLRKEEEQNHFEVVDSTSTLEGNPFDSTTQKQVNWPNFGESSVFNKQQQQHQQEDNTICDADRETPTNCLIRSLIHRDRMALLTSGSGCCYCTNSSSNSNTNSHPHSNRNTATPISVQNKAQTSSNSSVSMLPNVAQCCNDAALFSSSSSSGYETNAGTTQTVQSIGLGDRSKTHNINHNDSGSSRSGTGSGSGFGSSQWVQPSSVPSSSSDNKHEPKESSFKSSAEASDHPPRRRSSVLPLPLPFSSPQPIDKCFPVEQATSAASQVLDTEASGAKEAEEKLRRESLDLSALIGKRLLVSSTPLANNNNKTNLNSKPATLNTNEDSYRQQQQQQPLRTLRSVSPRRPSDWTLETAKSKVPPPFEKETQRRHSTYMLPLLLKPTSSSSSSEEVSSSEEEERLFGGEDNEEEEANLYLGGKANNVEDEEEAQVKQQLRNSASSPSALSSSQTPTNHLSTGTKTHCSINSSRFQVHQFGQQQKSACNKNGERLRRGNALSGAGNRRVSLLEGGKNEQMVEQHERANKGQANAEGRINNEKLNWAQNNKSAEEVQVVSGGKQNSRRRQSSATKLQQPKQPTHQKRHSLISLVLSNQQSGSGSGIGNQLVSRWLSHPRSLFASNPNQNSTSASSGTGVNNLKQNIMSSSGSSNNRSRQQRNSMQNELMKQEQLYDPLIPESGFKIVVMGTSGSGKTSIIQRFIYNSFSWRHNPTVEDTYFIEFPYKKNTINISISDTSGTYQFPAMRKLAINSGDAFILVYSVDNPKSLDDLEQLRQSILDEREQAYSEASASTMSNNCEFPSGSSSGFGSRHSSQVYDSRTQLQAPQTTAASAHQQQLQSHTGRESHLHSSHSPSRHWSLASIFNSNNNNNQHHHHLHQLHHDLNSQNQSMNSSICSSSCSSSTDNSRRSSVSISAAEAALKTRRTRHPPMVIVANKHDLPDEQHLVNSDEIEALAVIDWNNGFIRASAAMNLNIDEIFQQVLKQARQPPTLSEAIVSKRRKSLPPKLPQQSK